MAHRLLIFPILFLAWPTLLFGASPIVIDHNFVEQYTNIPTWKISMIQTQWVVYAGESHSTSLGAGAVLLSNANYTFPGTNQTAGTPANYNCGLRVSKASWGDVDHTTGWRYNYGEEDWYTSVTASNNTKSWIRYANTNGFPINILAFGWCWDMTWHNLVSSSGTNTTYGTRWAGASVGGPEGDLAWGLTADDYSLTANTVCMDTYLWATKAYDDYCVAQGWPTRVVFTTGPIDGGYDGESAYQRSVKNTYIRQYVTNNNAILFDFADILAWDNAGSYNTNDADSAKTSWNGHIFPFIAADNLKNLDGSDGSGTPGTGYHFGERGATRLGKAMWVLASTIIPDPTTFHYVRQGASGLNDGSDWVNAWTDLPDTFQRGHTYYVADGTYGAHTLNTDIDGTTRIYIKKAVALDHGTDTGWLSTYGDGVATFAASGTVLTISSSCWTIDGQTGSGTSGHGIKVNVTGTAGSSYGIRLSGTTDDITLAHIESLGSNPAGVAEADKQDGIYAVATGTNLLVQYCYLHEWKRAGVLMDGLNDSTVEHCYFHHTYSFEAAHGQAIQLGSVASAATNITFRYNDFKDCHGTAFIAWLNGSFDHIDVYGSTFWATEDAAIGLTGTSQAVGSNTASDNYNCSIHNNTFVGLHRRSASDGEIDLSDSDGRGNTAYNNLWYDSLPSFSGVTHDYNAADIDLSEAHSQLIGSDPFTASASGNFHLAAATQAGTTLASPYNTDPDGVTRGSDGTWDRGAYEYTSTPVVTTLRANSVTVRGTVSTRQ